MKLEHENLEKLKKQILEIVGSHINLDDYRVFFFGSRVTGRSRGSSDIDVGIEGSQPLPAGALSNIQEEIEELPILYKIDVVDFATVNEKFKTIAKEHIELVN